MSRLGTPRTLAPAVVIAAALTTAGCGITNPYSRPAWPRAAASTSSSTTVTTATGAGSAAHADDPSQPAPRILEITKSSGSAGARTARQALKRYALLYVNWSSRTLAYRQDRLAAMSAGRAHAQALQAAASYRHDPQLARGHVINHGQLIALAPGQGSLSGQWVLVTRERTTGAGSYAGLPASDHVTDATLQHTRHGWVITQWSPQN